MIVGILGIGEASLSVGDGFDQRAKRSIPLCHSASAAVRSTAPGEPKRGGNGIAGVIRRGCGICLGDMPGQFTPSLGVAGKEAMRESEGGGLSCSEVA